MLSDNTNGFAAICDASQTALHCLSSIYHFILLVAYQLSCGKFLLFHSHSRLAVVEPKSLLVGSHEWVVEFTIVVRNWWNLGEMWIHMFANAPNPRRLKYISVRWHRTRDHFNLPKWTTKILIQSCSEQNSAKRCLKRTSVQNLAQSIVFHVR